MDKKSCLTSIEKYLESGRLESNVFLGKRKVSMQKVFAKMKKNIVVLENDGLPQDNYKEEIINSLKHIRNTVMEVPVSKNDADFCLMWCELIGNINDNTEKDDEISKRLNFIVRLINQHLTINESIEVLRALNKKFRDVKNWMPPSFEVAKHYLDYLQE